MRSTARKSLIDYARKRLSLQLEAAGATPEEINEAKYVFSPEALTLGFARRFATYKRPNLLLHDQQRLTRILTNPHYPVQLIIAGKAHPADLEGQLMIQEWIRFIRQPHMRIHIMFLSDYDMILTEHLVQGVDVWLNTPRRPWEASGTSGMKVLVNGGLNVSELDGWWAEAYSPEVGWAIGDGLEHNNDPQWDAVEANSLYNILEQEIIPEFYRRDINGIPNKWIKRILESMSRLTPKYSSTRSIKEYTEKLYLPASKGVIKRTADQGKISNEIIEWRQNIEKNWQSIHFDEMNITTDKDHHTFEVDIYFKNLEANAIRVELFANSANNYPPVKKEMVQIRALSNGYVYRAQVPATRPVSDYTARIIPYHKEVSVPLEANQILWHK